MRKKKSNIRLEHRHFGTGEVLHNIATDAGDGLLVKFMDKRRIILVDSTGWANPPDAVAAFTGTPAEPKKEAPRKAIRVRAADDVDELETADMEK
jgi:hypothetical protein